ncbi:MAG TPA: winged helix-turn-helix domain-containing protein [Methanocella sp.]|jgi:predicted transcriptional regulator
MADDDKRDDVLLVLPLGDESKLITQTIANDTARQILELLAEGAMSTSAIAKRLEIPLTTAQYNVEKLIEAKLVVVEKTKYSEKGREVKLYAPARRMIVLVPANTSRQAVMDVLKKYLVLLPLAGFVALMVELAMQFLNGNIPGSPASKSADRSGGAVLTSQEGNLSVTGPTDTNAWYSGAPANPLVSNAWPNVTDGYDMKSMTGNVSGHVTTSNTTFGVGAADGIRVVPQNATLPYDNITGGYGTNMPELNRSMTAGPDVSGAIPQSTDVSSGSGHGLIPPDLLNHYGLWFFIGCVLIIGIMVAYELYRGRNKK